MGTLQTLSGILGLSFVSGVNLYATILTVGLGLRYGWIHGLPDDLNILSHPAVLIVAGVFYAAEFIADKVPFFTPIWDTVHTVIRPLGAAALAFGAASDMNPLMKVVAVLVGGSVALSTHSTKMGMRLAAHAVPEPVTHSAISIAEDVGVVSLAALAMTHPLVALPVTLALLVAVFFLIRMVFRALRAFSASTVRRIRAFL
jgi:hypothetical protein